MGYRVFWRRLNSRHHKVPQNRNRLFIIAVLRARCAHNTFPWPRDLPEVGINTILEPLTRSEKKSDLNVARPSQAGARANVDLAYKKMMDNGLEPASVPMVIDVDGTKPSMMYNISPCLTRTRAANGGHWLSCRGRRMTLVEMIRLMGLGNPLPNGKTHFLIRLDGVCDRQFKACWAMPFQFPCCSESLLP